MKTPVPGSLTNHHDFVTYPEMGWTEMHSAAGDDDVQVGVCGARSARRPPRR